MRSMGAMSIVWTRDCKSGIGLETLFPVLAVEAFNLLNHSNFGSYNVAVTSSAYGTPTQTTSAATGVPVEWRPRSLQFLARFGSDSVLQKCSLDLSGRSERPLRST